MDTTPRIAIIGAGHGMNDKDREVNRTGDSRGVYVREPDGHGYELFTAGPARAGASR